MIRLTACIPNMDERQSVHGIHTTGGECTEWDYKNKAALALAVGAYVQPFVSYRQVREGTINAAPPYKNGRR